MCIRDGTDSCLIPRTSTVVTQTCFQSGGDETPLRDIIPIIRPPRSSENYSIGVLVQQKGAVPPFSLVCSHGISYWYGTPLNASVPISENLFPANTRKS